MFCLTELYLFLTCKFTFFCRTNPLFNTFAKKNVMLKSLEPKVLDIVKDGNKSVDDRLGEICELLRSNVAHYDWVGFYFKNGDKEEYEEKQRKNK